MYRINENIFDWDGKAILNDKLEPATIKGMLLIYVGMWVPKEPSQVVMSRAIGQKIYDCDDVLVLDEDELALLKEMVSKPRHGMLVMDALYKTFDMKFE